MGVKNIVHRTMCLVKEKDSIKRIPWDLCFVDGQDGGFVSQMQINPDGFNDEVTTSAYVPAVSDMFYDGINSEVRVNSICNMQFFDSEQQFYSLFDNAFGSYYSGVEEFGG